jgi:hypothetical protein
VSVRWMKIKLAKLIDAALLRCGTRLVIESDADEPSLPLCSRVPCRCKLILIQEVIVNTPEEVRAVLARNEKTP